MTASNNDPIDGALRLAMAVVTLAAVLALAAWFWWAVLT